jgi:hypothetical protein
MGIIARDLHLEEYLDTYSKEWFLLSDKEYRTLIKEWKISFEERLISKSTVHLEKVNESLKSKFPINCFVFNCPNYGYLPNNQGADRQQTYAYKVNNLSSLDRNVLNSIGSILCSENFSFMCAFNPDGPVGFPEVYCEA